MVGPAGLGRTLLLLLRVTTALNLDVGNVAVDLGLACRGGARRTARRRGKTAPAAAPICRRRGSRWPCSATCTRSPPPGREKGIGSFEREGLQSFPPPSPEVSPLSLQLMLLASHGATAAHPTYSNQTEGVWDARGRGAGMPGVRL